MIKTIYRCGGLLLVLCASCTPKDDRAERQIGGKGHIFGAEAPRVTFEELSRFLGPERVEFVDVRDREDFESQHILGALSIPLSHLWFRWDEIPPADRVVTYCACEGDVAGARAAVALLDRGLKNVAVLQGGITKWVAGGGKVGRVQASDRALK